MDIQTGMFKIKLLKRRLRFLWQKITRGWTDEDTWNLDVVTAKFLIPRLQRFRELHNGYPMGLSEDIWLEYLDQMIFSFQKCATRFENDDWDTETSEKIQQGLNRFAEYFQHLWW